MEREIYRARAELYDRIYHWKDYPGECRRLAALLAAEGVGPGSRVLDAGCGTGAHLVHLRETLRVDGFDLHEAMVAEARAKAPDATLFVADMADFRVDQPYDAVLSLFSAIGYVHPEERLRAAARCFAAAVRPGGALVVEPWFTPESWTVGNPSLQTFDSPDLKLARATVSDRSGDLAVTEMHWLVARRGQPVEHFVERHELWLCPRAVLLGAFADAGFDVRFEEDGLLPKRGLVIGRRRPSA